MKLKIEPHTEGFCGFRYEGEAVIFETLPENLFSSTRLIYSLEDTPYDCSGNLFPLPAHEAISSKMTYDSFVQGKPPP